MHKKIDKIQRPVSFTKTMLQQKTTHVKKKITAHLQNANEKLSPAHK
jgi:hypothetical protein